MYEPNIYKLQEIISKYKHNKSTSMETIQLTKQDALKLYNETTKEGKKFLEEKFGDKTFSFKIEDRINSFEDACRENGIEPEDVLPYTDPQTPDEKSINAYAKLVQIIRAFNEGKIPDWKNSSQYKYYPWFWMDGRKSPSGSGLSFDDFDFVVSYTCVASRLCLLEQRHVEIVAKKFEDIYIDYMTQ